MTCHLTYTSTKSKTNFPLVRKGGSHQQHRIFLAQADERLIVAGSVRRMEETGFQLLAQY